MPDKEAQLRPMDITVEDAELASKDLVEPYTPELYLVVSRRSLHCRERHLREANAQIAALAKQVEELKQGADEDDALREQMSKILTDTANELHGGPYKNGLWSWHDLAELAKALWGRSEKAEAELAALRCGKEGA